MYFEAKPPKLQKNRISFGIAGCRGIEQHVLDLVENDTVRLVDTEQSNDGAQDGHANHDLIVRDR